MYKVLFVLMIFTRSISSFSRAPSKLISPKRIKEFYKDFYKKNDYTLEHVVPQSKIKKIKNNGLTNDMHNLLYYPRMLNVHRSNYKYTNDMTIYDSSLVLDEYGLTNNKEYLPEINSIKTSKKQIFCPNQKYRGAISRSCMYFLYTYEDYEEIIFNEVIDKHTLLLWHYLYPATEQEYKKNEIILNMQGNENIFIKDPKQLYLFMESLK